MNSNNPESITSRRSFLIGAIGTGAGVLILNRIEVAHAQNSNWADKFIWTAESAGLTQGLPDTATSPDGKIGDFEAIIESNQTVVMVASQFDLDADDAMIDGITGQVNKLSVKGRKDHPVVLVMGGKVGETVRRNLTNMPVRGAWAGVIENPSGNPLTDQELWEVMRVRIEKLRDPKLNNCSPGIGCQGPVEYVIINGDGIVADHGSRRV